MKKAIVFLVAVTAFTGLLQQAFAAPLLDSVLGGMLNTVGTAVGGLADMAGTTDAVLNTPGEGEKAPEDIDSILSKLKHETTESQTKTNGAAGKTNNEFKSLITKYIDECNASLHHIVNAVKNAFDKATCGKKQRLNKVKKWLDAFKALSKGIENGLRGAAVNDDKNKLKDLKAHITKAIPETEAALLDVLANLDSTLQAIFKKHMEIIINVAKTVIAAIEKHLSGQ